MDTTYADLEVKEQVQRELNARVAQTLVDNAAEFGTRYMMAMLSVVNGRWDDMMKDVERNKITADQAIRIIDDLEQARLIPEQVGISRREQVLGITA